MGAQIIHRPPRCLRGAQELPWQGSDGGWLGLMQIQVQAKQRNLPGDAVEQLAQVRRNRGRQESIEERFTEFIQFSWSRRSMSYLIDKLADAGWNHRQCADSARFVDRFAAPITSIDSNPVAPIS